MPVINVKMLEGRTHEQKQQLVAAITDAMVNICKTDADGVMVVIEDVARENWGRNGKLLSDT